jgi:hypothetical protein
LAADVNRNGSVTALDAAYILEHAVGLLGVPFPGAGQVWAFSPVDRSYPLLNSDQSGQDFTAVLIGDVSGNWQAPGASGSPLPSASEGQQPVQLRLADAAVGSDTQVLLPLFIETGDADVFSLDMVLTYDPALLAIVNTDPGAAAAGSAMAVNAQQPGVIRIGLASAAPLAQDGELLEFVFDVLGELASPAEITISDARINEGTVEVDRVDGHISDPPPSVTAVAVHGSAWDVDNFHEIPLGGPEQLGTLAWNNVDQIRITFSEDVVVDIDDLQLLGVEGSEYAASGFHYDAIAATATWRLAEPLAMDRLVLSLSSEVRDSGFGALLDGEWTDGESTVSGDGHAGGEFNFTMIVLPGDVDQSGTVDRSDAARLIRGLGTSEGASVHQGDLDGDGRVGLIDLARLQASLGAVSPASPAVLSPSAALATETLATSRASAADHYFRRFVQTERGETKFTTPARRARGWEPGDPATEFDTSQGTTTVKGGPSSRRTFSSMSIRARRSHSIPWHD